MTKINWKVRLKNPVFWMQTGLAVLTPMLAYMGIRAEQLTTWPALASVLIETVSNPYVLFAVLVSLWNAVNDPTTAGISDSSQALTYVSPKK